MPSVIAAASLAMLASCTVSPFSGKLEGFDDIQKEFDQYQNDQQQQIDDITNDIKAKQQLVQVANNTLDQRRNMVQQVVAVIGSAVAQATGTPPILPTTTTQPADGSAGPPATTPQAVVSSNQSGGALAPVMASALGLAAVGLQTDNRRKDRIIGNAKAINKSRNLPQRRTITKVAVDTGKTGDSSSNDKTKT